MHKQIGKIGAIRRELDGKACSFCGCRKYQLVLRGNMQPQAVDSSPAALSASVLVDWMKTSLEYSGCKKLPHHLNTGERHGAHSLFPNPIHKVTQNAQETETNRVAHVGSQWCGQTQPC